MLLFNKVPLDKDGGGVGGSTNALGQWVSWAAQPWHTHTWGSKGGAGWAQSGAEDLP